MDVVDDAGMHEQHGDEHDVRALCSECGRGCRDSERRVQLRCSRCIQRMAKRRSERRELCDSDRAELRIGRSELECRAV